ncbi:DUF5133 domain-containing protein [Streptomyces sp. WAC07094]|uniref:DUF5133 domain-containing protein n=1 Tax=Streptomyces sp. WAC07094 TaxID=3072183 RepID=UPI002EC74E87|nr:DUF5133 domain-containing protein [Streptomyces sp. WAC07094]
MSSNDAARSTCARDGALDSKIDRRGSAVPLVPDPKVVRSLLTRYASLQIALAESEKLERARELEDVSYTLCVMTGTRSVARRHSGRRRTARGRSVRCADAQPQLAGLGLQEATPRRSPHLSLTRDRDNEQK